ncbi:MAG: pitrilysin family protein [Alphaproteobacteria bacterium]|nr:pitrilysin family protein [Alphaproteobacteria bacterium]
MRNICVFVNLTSWASCPSLCLKEPAVMIGRMFVIGLVWLGATVLPARALEVQRVVSPGGIEAWLVEDHSNPIISMDFAFPGGASADPAGKEGLAHMVSGLLDEGAGDLDSQAFQRRLAELSIRLSFDAGLDTFQGIMRTLKENQDTAFDLLRLALTAPRFDEEPVGRIRSQIRVQLERESESPRRIAGRALRQAMFPNHPYARPTHGTLESLPAITVEDLRRFVADRLALDVLKIAVVGDITAKELAVRLDETFGALPGHAAPFEVADVVPRTNGEVVVIERDLPQSVVIFGHAGIKRDDPDFYAAYVVNHILGGGSFNSRLFEEVREKRGLAYSVYSYLHPLDHAGLVMGGVATQNARTGESLEVIRLEWKRMSESGPTREELEDAKTYLTGSYPLRFSSTANIAGTLLVIQLDDLGIDYVNERNKLIEAVTLEDARRVANELFQADELNFVIVGRPLGVLSDGTTTGDGDE